MYAFSKISDCLWVQASTCSLWNCVGTLVILKKWQVNIHWALPCHWNVCNSQSEQVCWVALTQWCLCPNQRSLSRQRVKYEFEKKPRWPSLSSFLTSPEFLYQDDCCVLCRSPLGIRVRDPKILLLHHVSNSSSGLALRVRGSFFEISSMIANSCSFRVNLLLGDSPWELHPVNKVGNQARLYFESKTSCE